MNYAAKYIFLQRAEGEIILYFEPRIAFPPDGRECENSLETLSPSVGILVRTLNGISMRFPLAYFLLSSPQPGPEPRLG